MIHDAINRLFLAVSLFDSKKKGFKHSGRNHNACFKEPLWSSSNYQVSEATKDLMFYYVNTQLNKLDHFGQMTGPSVLTCSIHVNSHETMNIISMRSFRGKNHVKKFCPRPLSLFKSNLTLMSEIVSF